MIPYLVFYINRNIHNRRCRDNVLRNFLFVAHAHSERHDRRIQGECEHAHRQSSWDSGSILAFLVSNLSLFSCWSMLRFFLSKRACGVEKEGDRELSLKRDEYGVFSYSCILYPFIPASCVVSSASLPAHSLHSL